MRQLARADAAEAAPRPGVPDIYQGTELWDFSLVDPDNRRPVDYAARSKWLSEINARARFGAQNLGPTSLTRGRSCS